VEIDMENQTLNTKTSGLSARLLNAIIRQPILVVAIVAVVTGLGLYLNWPTIVTLGLAPLVFTIAPCALMCALGLCGMSASKNMSDSKPPTEDGQP
jgi:uncharacterized RDD family membrane protein YckC